MPYDYTTLRLKLKLILIHGKCVGWSMMTLGQYAKGVRKKIIVNKGF